MRNVVIASLACVALLAGCSSSSSGTPGSNTPEPDGGTPESDAGGSSSPSTFTAVYGDIISPICVTCHNPTGVGVSTGHLDMSSQTTAIANLVGIQAMGAECSGQGVRVVAGSADTSVLYQKVTAPKCGAQMPLDGTPLTKTQTDEIASWINGGALND